MRGLGQAEPSTHHPCLPAGALRQLETRAKSGHSQARQQGLRASSFPYLQHQMPAFGHTFWIIRITEVVEIVHSQTHLLENPIYCVQKGASQTF